MGANVRLDVVDKRKSLVPAGNRAPARQSSHYIAYATLEQQDDVTICQDVTELLNNGVILKYVSMTLNFCITR
jgi:hypothetical protein